MTTTWVVNEAQIETTPHVGLKVVVVGGRLRLSGRGWQHVFHPQWLLERSTALGHADAVTRQRLFEPTEVCSWLRVERAAFSDDRATLLVEFVPDRSLGDICGVAAEVSVDELLVAAEQLDDPDALPPRERWFGSLAAPRVSWLDLDEPDSSAHHDVLEAFHRFGWFVITDAPTTPGSLIDIAGRFGRVAPTNFGDLFDVETRPVAVDLAYTPVGLAAHSDQPYRDPAPGLQFLHTLVNSATGGASTVVDGLAAVEALAVHDPLGAELLSTVMVEFRYDIGTDVVIDRAPIIKLDATGGLGQLRFSTRLDFVPPLDVNLLDRFYAARRWLAEWLADAAHRVEFKMEAGDVLVVDNHRVLHGRTAFDPSSGHRHLQGCYIDHDGPATQWRLGQRRRRASQIEEHP